MARQKKTMDANAAAAYVSYAYTEVAAIYPITPSSPMADAVDQMSVAGKKNVFGNVVKVQEMQAESGAAGAVHGSLNTGALTTTYTASQGLLLMIPNMYKIAGELLPCVFHVTARAVASHALSIFGDQSDVMACRQTGFAMLCENNVQEVMDLSPVAHLAAVTGRVPFINFFDGFRTSHEIQKVEMWDYEDLKDMLDMEAVQQFRDRALNPNRPTMRGSHENGDIFFQNREASNPYYDRLPEVVEECMDKVNSRLGTDYKLFNYYGAEDAERVIVAMGSICDTCEEVIDYLTARGEKVGLVKVRLYRPFSAERLVKCIPETARKIAVLDRTKEPGSQGEPLYMDVVAALAGSGRTGISICGGRYGLGSKDTPPRCIFSVFTELEKDSPRRQFTVGIEDDVTNLSLPEEQAPDVSPEGTITAKFWGLGGDGTVGANKNSIKIIGDHTEKYVQAYFQYDSKKTGGITISHLRFGDQPIKSAYYVTSADFVACHNPSYISNGLKIVQDVKPGGVFLVNSQWSDEELAEHLPAESKKYIAENNIRLYSIDAIDLARQIGMGKRTNTILQAAFFSLAKIIPIEEAVQYMKDAATKSYMKKGKEIVEMNHKAIETGTAAYHEVKVPDSWKDARDETAESELEGRPELVKMVRELTEPINRMEGDRIPVSKFMGHEDGTFELGASAYEKRGVAVTVPSWDPDKCVQCNNCAFVCPHACLRPFMLTPEEAENAPKAAKIERVKTGKGKGKYKFTMTVSPLDCMGCGICSGQCPTHALDMKPLSSQMEQQEVYDYLVKLPEKEDMYDATTRFSQYHAPLLEYSGSCAGCAETSYARVLTQLFGDHMIISNATGCSSIWGGPAAVSPYTVNQEGKGPAWANSLFEDNAEHGLGIYLGQKKIRDDLRVKIEALSGDSGDEELREACDEWIESYDDGKLNQQATKNLVEKLSQVSSEQAEEILEKKDYLNKKSIWILGGDGWAYDIGYGGLDHVLASGEDVNVLVFNTEVYSNTGGQASKASRIGQVAQFAAAGKELKSKALAEMAMTYGYVYVAQVAMGADKGQTLKAMVEAEEHKGPSLIIGYSPCEMHSIKGGMKGCQREMDRAVKSGYWNLFRFNPDLEDDRFSIDSREPSQEFQQFLDGEARYASLKTSDPERAEKLDAKAAEDAREQYEHLLKLQEMYE